MLSLEMIAGGEGRPLVATKFGDTYVLMPIIVR